MMGASALSSLPTGLREPLISEYQGIVQNYSEHRWSPSELSGGRFCEIVFTILEGYAIGTYATGPTKPKDFVTACRKLEANTSVPRSFQILIPRLLPALYEVRNNRGVGHVGGEVNPNHMDATFVLTSCNWIMAELVRVFHKVPTEQAQELVDGLIERRIPLIWEGDDIRRILSPEMTLREEILVFLATAHGKVATADLLAWTDYKNKSYFFKLLRELHAIRNLELSKDELHVQALPPGTLEAAELVRKYSNVAL